MDGIGVRILWALSAGFLFGVFVRSVFPIGDAYAGFFALMAFCCIASCAIDTRHATRLIVCGTALFACAVGMARMQGAILTGDPALDERIGKHVVIDGVISAEPDVRDTQVRVAIKVSSVADSTSSPQASSSAPLTSAALAVLPAHTPVYYGEKVRVAGTLALPEAFDAGAGRKFDYPGYLAAQGISYELDFAQMKDGTGFAGNPLTAGAISAKQVFVSGLQRALPEPQSGLAGGITAGDKRALGKDLTQEFRTVSLVHIIVLSGYNITVVINAIFRISAWAPRAIRFGAGGFVAIFFAVMTGFASASLRAALMALIAISGQASGRIYKPERALAVVAVAMIAWDPYLLVFDPGFQLSFLATIGLMAFSPIFTLWYARVTERFGLREILVSTSSAQIAVLPLILYESGNLSLVSLPANLLVLAAVPPAMLFSCVAAIGGLVLGGISVIPALPAYLTLSYILGVAHALAQIPFASVTVPAFPAWLLVPVYCALFGYAWRWRQGEVHKETTP